MKCEHFLIGYFPGLGQRVTRSSRVNEVLSFESWQHLLRQGGNLDSEIVTVTNLCAEKMMAVSYLRPTVDELGRKGVWNHTVLIPCVDISKALAAVLDPLFIKGLIEAPKANLEPLDVNL
jgi:hypothetical protein